MYCHKLTVAPDRTRVKTFCPLLDLQLFFSATINVNGLLSVTLGALYQSQSNHRNPFKVYNSLGFKALPECSNICDIMHHARWNEGWHWRKKFQHPSQQLDTPVTEAGRYYKRIKVTMFLGMLWCCRGKLKTDKIMEGKSSEGSDERIWFWHRDRLEDTECMWRSFQTSNYMNSEISYTLFSHHVPFCNC